MHVRDLMTKEIVAVPAKERLNEAARIMWEQDCGFVPVVDTATGKPVGVLTDRDVCMAAYTQGIPLHDIPVTTAMAKVVQVVREEDNLETVHELMRNARVRRVPVVNQDGRLAGVLSLHDLAQHAKQGVKGLAPKDVFDTYRSICTPRARRGARAPDRRVAARLEVLSGE